jgi:hypothetical protein
VHRENESTARRSRTPQLSRWVDFLSPEDLAFLKRFILASGSQKELAQAYSVSYPTVRLRLSRLIEKIRVLDDPGIESAFERLVRSQFAEGRIDQSTMDSLLRAHHAELEGGDERGPEDPHDVA